MEKGGSCDVYKINKHTHTHLQTHSHQGISLLKMKELNVM